MTTKGEGLENNTTVLTREATSLLWDFGLRVNDELKSIICWTCGQGIEPEPMKIVNHLKKKHRRKGQPTWNKSELLSRLTIALKGYKFQQLEHIRNQPAGRAPIPGIKVHSGFYCSVLSADGIPCSSAFLKLESLYQHTKSCPTPSNKEKKKKKELQNYACDCQTIFTSSSRKYFRVKTGLVDQQVSPVNPYSVFVQQEMSIPGNSDLGMLEKFRNEELPSLLRMTRWHLYVEKYRGDPQDVVDLIQLPTAGKQAESWSMGKDEPMEETLKKLPVVSEAWVAQAHRYWQMCTHPMHRALYGHPT